MLRIDRESHTPLYLQIVEQIRAQVNDGTLKVGDRLPSTRELAQQYDLHRNTICAAFEELTANGIISSHVGKGTFIVFNPKEEIKAPTAPAPSFTHVWDRLFTGQQNEDAFTRLIAQGYPKSCISFANAVPIADLFSFRRINKVVNEVFREKRMELVEFGEAAGYRPLREQLAEKMRGYGIRTDADGILITNGVQESLTIIREVLLRPGDLALVENPTYPGALRVFRKQGVRCVAIPVTRDGLDLEMVQSLFQHERPGLIYTTPAFHNPTGRTMSLVQRRRLLSLAYQYGVPIVEDDIYSDLRYEGHPVPSLKSMDNAGAVIYLSSFSKVGFAGLRVGWMIAPRMIAERFIAAKETQDLHTNVLGQAILSELVHGGLLTRHLKKVRLEYAMRRDGMIAALGRHFPQEATYVKPEGGMSMWITLPPEIDAATLLTMALQKDVVFSPGMRFYLTGGLRNTMRLTFTLKEMAKIEQGVRILGTLLKQMMLKSKQKTAERTSYRAALV